MIHHVFANRSNIGDWLSARGIQSLIAPRRIAEHLCDEPFVPRTLDRLSRAATGDTVIIGGGGLFMDYFIPFWEGFRKIADRVPFCIWGAGYCDLKREPSCAPVALLEEIVAKSQMCIVRDALSRDRLASCNLPRPVPCPSISALEGASRPGWGLLHVDNYTTAGAKVYEAMDALGIAFAAQTLRPFRKTNNRISPGSVGELSNILTRYAASDLVLSSALHGCIIALAMGRKVLAVSGDRKIESFMNAAGLGDWVCDIDEIGTLAGRLPDLPHQPCCRGFVEWARRENRAIADRILAAGDLV